MHTGAGCALAGSAAHADEAGGAAVGGASADRTHVGFERVDDRMRDGAGIGGPAGRLNVLHVGRGMDGMIPGGE